MISIKGPLTAWLEGKIERVEEISIESVQDGYIECRNCILTHGLFNAHTHLPMVLLRGFCDGLYLTEWLKCVEKLELEMKDREIWAGYLLGIWENLINGVTKIYNMYRKYELIEETFGVEVLAGPFSSKDVVEGIDVLSVVERWKKNAPENVTPALYLHSVYKVPQFLLRELSEVKDLPLQIHVGETKEEMLWSKKYFGNYPVRVLNNFGLLHRNTFLVHGGWTTKGELDLISKAGSSLVHVPAANMKLAVHGFFPWKEAVERRIDVYFGTDSPASNDGQDIRNDVRIALLWVRDRYWDASVLDPVKTVEGLFDREAYVLWKTKHFVHPKSIVNTFLFSPSSFYPVLVVKRGKIVFPRKEPSVLRKARKIAINYVERVSVS